LPVPVLAEPKEATVRMSPAVGEARESTKGDSAACGPERGTNPVGSEADSRGGQTSCETTVVNKTFTPELDAIIAQNSVIKNGLPAMSPPWENREDTERDIKMLCDTLKLFCGAPVYKGRVREALREAKIIK